ncbi:hypothetical protein DNTS_011989 [Danionella cerebrum]|uniref:Uncharacterized protein n=1 Tax=Danionella cerebrum TaxID=2873325 RepID=A0A553RPT1_9TELE|nr:hypothetical protein DNTS_011989 [Danionella translucida]
MVKRKSLDDGEQENCRGIPFPIQTFLWRQTSAFLRPKLGKQYEASCVSFERVLVENKLHGLSPALTEAIQSIPRWELVQAALPHVLHCTSILLSNRNKLGHQDKLGVAETKLLHTLHWMLLEAAQECHFEPGQGHGWSAGSSGDGSAYNQPMGNQGLTERNSSTSEDNAYARSKVYHKNMATVELFVFLFAPLINRIKESDLTFRLAGGLVIWQPMWEHRQPDVPAFSALIKPMRNIFTAKRNSPVSNPCNPHDRSNPCPSVLCESALPDSSPSLSVTGQGCRRGNSVEKGGSIQQAFEKGFSQQKNFSVSGGVLGSQRAKYATYFDVAVLRCLMQPHWTEEGVHWALIYYLQRLRQILQEKPEWPPEPLVTPLARPRSSSMVAATPSLVNTHKTQDMTLKCNEESRSLSSETFSKVSITNLRRPAVPDLSTEMGMNIFKKFKNRREDRERKGSIPFHHTGKKRQRRMGVPFLMHEDHLDVSPTRSTFSFGSFSGLGDDRRALDRGGWPSTIMVRSQISTITMATFNTTVASFNVGYTDFFTEHIKKLCNPIPIPEMPCEPLACSNLPRSLTDSCINYSSLEDRDTIEGTNNFVLKNGMLDLTAVLRALNSVLTHEISSRICDVVLNIIECLLQLGVVPSGMKKTSRPDEKPEDRLKDGAHGEGAGESAAGPDAGGGADGGGGGESRGGSRDDIKTKDEDTSVSTHRLALNMLIKIVKSLGCAYGCGEGHRGLSGDRLRMQAQCCLTTLYKLDKVQFRQTMKEYVNKDSLNNIVDFLHALLGFCMEPITDKYGSADKAGFGNNFTTGGDKSLAQSMEAVVVGCMFKSLITRCASTTHELHSSENLGLYCDIRQLVQFIKESHGNVFRRVALSALLDSAEKLNTTKKADEKEESKHSGVKNEEQIPGALLGRKDFWRKMFKSQSAASDTSSQSEQDTSECTTAHSGTTTDRRSRSRSRRISLRKKLKLPIVKLSEESAFEYGREEEENFFKRLGKWRSGRRNPSKIHHTEEKDGCPGFQERLAASQEAMKNKNIVNLGAIRQGMKRFQFLLNCCEPGTIPDASILAAALDLEAPVVARASLFLECARFVHRCNRGNWPEWMKGHHVNITKRGLSRGRSPVAGNKRNTKLQWNAAKYFYHEICHLDSESPANILGFIYDEESKRRAKKEDEEEDYLDDKSCRLRLDPELSRHRYERKISFAGILDDEDGHDSLNSSCHTLKSDTGCEEKKSSQEPLAPIRKIRIGGSRLLQIKGARSFRVKKGGSLSSIRRAGSLKSTKMSRQDSESEIDADSERMLSQSRDTVTDIAVPSSKTKTGSPWSASEPSIEPEGQSSTGGVEDNYHRNMSWLHIMILLCNQQSFICTHVDFCHPRCYQRHSRSCARLVRAIKLLYGETVDSMKENSSLGNISGRPKKTKESLDKSCLRTPSMKKRPNDSNAEGKKDTGMLKYIRNQVMSLSPAPLSLLIKAAPILTEDMYGDTLPAAWELLMSVDEHMAAAAAALFLLCAVKVPDGVTEMMMAEFQHQEACQRINSILKFYTIWRFRYQVWPRMEEGAQQIFKIPPPSINFTLPSPILGMPCVPIFDPPWVPVNAGTVPDAISEDQSKSFSARAVSRSHQRAEHILKNMQQEEEKRRLGREASIITAIPIAQEACYEPSCSPPPEQEEEVDDVVNLTSRRLSVSPSCASSNSHRNYSFRRGSVWSMRSVVSSEDDENTTELTPTHHLLQPPQAVFPPCICAAVLPIVHLMEDRDVREDGVAVCAVAQQVLWNCLIEDPALVLRHFLEKLTVSNRQDELMYMLRKLLLNIGDLPAQTSHILFNYLVGLIMYFVRTPCEWGMDAISATLTFLWEVVGYVEGLFFKDLKQTMKKEQCEVKLLVTASMPGTKTLVVHGQNECDIPTQLPVHEDTQFEALLKECLEFFNIPEARSANFFLMDKRWNLIHYAKTYVRDIYPFRRSVSPQLNLVHMLPEKGLELIQKQVFSRKLEEIGRVLFIISLTQRMPAVHKQSHVSMLQEDLLRLPSFPRKELFGLDTLHKVLWIKLLEEMFLGMPSEYPWGDEIMLFLNVFNGALHLHPEDSALLRQYSATAINTAVHFNHLFSLSGYQWILPTMLQTYADYEGNPLLRRGLEFCCRQFYILHRKPFILQLFASVAPLLEFTNRTSTGLSKGVSSQCLFDLLVSLEGETADALDALELVKAEKPLRSLDFCYGNEDLAFSISEAIKLCVTVVAYAPESYRSLQMLMVLEALVPCYLQKMKCNTQTLESASAARDEIAAIASLATSLQALLHSVEALTRPMAAPQMGRSDQGHKGATTANHTMSGGVNTRDNIHLLEEGQGILREELDERIAREEFRRPRESLLNICTEFYKLCGPRLKILQNVAGEPRVSGLELLDIKSHMSRGLCRYITEMLPITDWSAEAIRPALILILKRLDRMFNKIHKMPTLRRQVEWEAASSLIEGICLTLHRQPIISFLPHLRSLINVCVNLVMGVVGPSSVADGLPLLHLSPYLSPPLPFSTAVVRLVAMQIQALKDDFPLSHVISPFTNQERREGMLLNLLIPFVLTVGSGSKVINILLPPRIISTSRSKNFVLEASPAHCSTPGDTGKDLRREGLAESTSQAAYLALKVVLVCFERQLGNQWYKLSLQVKEMALRKVGGLAFWDFIDFIVRTRISIFILLRPFIQCKLLTQPAESQEEITARHHIAEQLERRFIPRSLCKSSLFAEFSNELKILKEAVHSGSAYQGKTSISTVGTSTSAYRLSLATMSRSNTGTGTVWEQESQPSRQPSQDTMSRTDEEEEDNDSVSIPSVVSEHEAFLPRLISQRRFSSHATGSATTQPEPSMSTMLPSHSEPNVLDESQGLLEEGNLSRVASVQSEPGQQNLLAQAPLGRKRGLRQLRRPLLSIQRVQDESRGRQGARLSTTRRSIQPKTQVDQKRSVTFTESQQEAAGISSSATPNPSDSQLTNTEATAAQCSSPSIKPDQPRTGRSQASQCSVRSSLSPSPSASRACSPLSILSTPSRLAPQIRESPEDEETTGLLLNTDSSIGSGEERGMENPVLAPQPRSPLILSPVDLDLDESHV